MLRASYNPPYVKYCETAAAPLASVSAIHDGEAYVVDTATRQAITNDFINLLIVSYIYLIKPVEN